MKRMNFRRPGGNERCGTCDDEAPGRRALHTMDRMARRARVLPLPGCFALRSDRLFPRHLVVAKSAALGTPRHGHSALRFLAPPLPFEPTSLGFKWGPKWENAVQGERDFDFPLPLKIPSP